MAIVQCDAKSLDLDKVSWHGNTIRSRFHEKYIPEPISGCWLWLGSTTGNNGYGSMRVDKASYVYSHRLSYLLHKGSIKTGQRVLHTCDNPICVNPNHLYLGTQLENIHDRDRKGRTRNRYSIKRLGPCFGREGGK